MQKLLLSLILILAGAPAFGASMAGADQKLPAQFKQQQHRLSHIAYEKFNECKLSVPMYELIRQEILVAKTTHDLNLTQAKIAPLEFLWQLFREQTEMTQEELSTSIQLISATKEEHSLPNLLANMPFNSPPKS